MQKTIRDLFLEGYVRVDQRTTIESFGCNIAKHTDEQIKILFYVDAEKHQYWYPEGEDIETFVYRDEKSEISFNHFRKLKSKFDNCSFIDVKDWEAISKIAAFKAADGQFLYLGDIVIYEGEVGRVVWVNSEFYIISDESNEHLTDLGSQEIKLMKVN